MEGHGGIYKPSSDPGQLILAPRPSGGVRVGPEGALDALAERDAVHPGATLAPIPLGPLGGSFRRGHCRGRRIRRLGRHHPGRLLPRQEPAKLGQEVQLSQSCLSDVCANLHARGPLWPRYVSQ